MLASSGPIARRSIGALARGLAVTLALGCTTGLGACSDASGEVTGGELRPGYDASAPPRLEVPEPTYEGASKTSWLGIYRDFFGRHSPASCAGSGGACHAQPDHAGARGSNFVCGDAAECYDSLRTHKTPKAGSPRALVEPADVANPAGAHLFEVIRYRTPNNTLIDNRGMPQVPSDYDFLPDAIDRMKTWIGAGALRD
jgi:hypothetical protein